MTEYLFRNVARTNIQHIVYAGSAPALTAVVGNQLELASVAMVASVPLVKSGQIKGLVLTSNRRVASLPDVPTLAEAGFPGNDYVTWVGLFMPARTPDAIVDRFLEAARQVTAMPEFREKLVAMSFEPETISGRQFREKVAAELTHWGKVVDTVGVKVE
jgi:tripartite-type tricarboxylate transporter receptor subunit TctC